MKKVIYTLLTIFLVTMLFTNIYAANLNNSTIMVAPYNESSEVVENTLDSLSVGIIVASVIIIAGVAFFYLLPKD